METFEHFDSTWITLVLLFIVIGANETENLPTNDQINSHGNVFPILVAL